MSVQQLLSSMCADLPDTDLNAIRKARGFSASESVSRTSFANFYITSVGLTDVLEQLSLEETLALHLLYEMGEVDISFFERLYGAGNSHGTYTQRYKPTFDTVKKNLVRRGLVVMAEVKVRGDTVQLQRWRFALPPEFTPFLKPLPSIQNSQAGQINESVIRKKLFQLINPVPSVSSNSLAIMVKQGSLYLKDQIFSIATLRDDQISAWERDQKVFKPNVRGSLSPVEAALKLLSSEKWMDPKVIEQVEIEAKYEGYILRERDHIARSERIERTSIPAWIDYDAIKALRYECREKLKRVRPETLGQATRVSGVTPADISVLSVIIKRGKLNSTSSD